MDFVLYVPEYEGNRERPVSERIVAKIRQVSYNEFSKFNQMDRSRRERDEEGNETGAIISNELEVQAEVLRSNLISLSGHKNFITDLPVTTPDELLDSSGDWPLVKEIVSAIYSRSILKAGLEKNLEPPSDGTQKSSLSGGIASNAGKKI